MLTYIRNWPEGLFIVLVMLAPFGVAYLLRPESVLGFLGIVGLGMLVGFATWLACIWVASTIHDWKHGASRR